MTPGIEPADSQWAEDDEDEPGKEEASRYRALVARAIYLSQGRVDIQFAAQELSRHMSRPTVGSMEGMKRLARYLKGREIMVSVLRYQMWTQTTQDAKGRGNPFLEAS